MLIIYTKQGCPWCREVREFLEEKRVPYKEREVLGSKRYFDELIAKSGQAKTPTVDFDGEILADTDRNAVELFLKEKKVLSR